MGVEAVGQEDHRPATELLLQQAVVQLGLRPAAGSWQVRLASTRARGRPSSPRYLVHSARAGGVGHPLHRVLVQPIGALRPVSILEHGVNVELPRPVLGEVQGLGDASGPLLLPPLGKLADLFRRLVEHYGLRRSCREVRPVHDHRVLQFQQQGGIGFVRLVGSPGCSNRR